MGEVNEGSEPSWPHLTAAVASMIWATLPVFMIGAMALQIRDELQIDLRSFSYLSAAYYSSSLALLVVAGWFAELVGSVSGMRLALLGDGAILLGIGLYANSHATLLGLLIVAGAVNSLAQPSANLHLVGNIHTRLMGTAFGVKQAAVPASTMIAGAAVPALGVTVGWRWAFILTGVLTLSSTVLVRGLNVRLPRVRGRKPEAGFGVLLSLGVCAGLASGPAVAMGVYLVTGARDAGLSVGAGGALLAIASFASIVARMVSGRRADSRPQDRLRVASWMMLVGAFGMAVLATGQLSLFVVGSVIGFAFGWGWPAIFVLSIIRMNPSAPAMAAAVTQMGAATGSILGPIVGGLAAKNTILSLVDKYLI